LTGTSASTLLLSALRQTARILDERHQPWALVGGLAVSIRVEPRFTRDIDLAVSVADDAAAETLVGDLVAAGFSLKISLEQQALGRLAAARVVPPGQQGEGIVVDLLFTSSGIEPEICRDAERLEIEPGLIVPVARSGHLVAMKVLALDADRPQDGIDLRGLVSQITPEERTRAVEAVARIEDLGANRGKALGAELARWLGAA
jgi:Nucleotidyl transferase AbiEii toxin, Type IV TA system